MVWYQIFKFFAFFVAEEADEVLYESWIVLLLERVVTLHTEGKTKANLVQVELVDVIEVLIGELGHLRVVLLYQLNHFDYGVGEHHGHNHERENASNHSVHLRFAFQVEGGQLPAKGIHICQQTVQAPF